MLRNIRNLCLLSQHIPPTAIFCKVRCINTSNERHNVSSHHVAVDGYNLHYSKAGTGPYTALCLPGALGTGSSDFGAQLSTLAGPEVTLIAWDPPGYGKSRPPQRAFTHDFLHKDAHLAANMMKVLGHDQYGVLGWSDGGISGIILAAHHPRAVHKLAVLAANAYTTEEDRVVYQSLRDVNAWSARMRAPMEQLYGVDGFRELWQAWVDVMTAIHDQGGDICKSEVAKVSCPSLVMQGSKDPVVPLIHAQYLHQHIPHARFEIFEGGKHNLHMKLADQFNEMVKKFFLES